MRPAFSPGGGESSQSFATNGPPSVLQRLLDHRMPPALDAKVERAVHLRAHVVAFDRECRERRRDIERSERLRGALDRFGRRRDLRGEALENLQLHAERAVGRTRDLRLQRGKLGGGEAHLAGKRLAMDEGRVQRRREQLLAVLRGHLDEITQHVVVAHLERAHAALVGVARLQARRPRGAIHRAAPRVSSSAAS